MTNKLDALRVLSQEKIRLYKKEKNYIKWRPALLTSPMQLTFWTALDQPETRPCDVQAANITTKTCFIAKN